MDTKEKRNIELELLTIRKILFTLFDKSIGTHLILSSSHIKKTLKLLKNMDTSKFNDAQILEWLFLTKVADAMKSKIVGLEILEQLS